MLSKKNSELKESEENYVLQYFSPLNTTLMTRHALKCPCQRFRARVDGADNPKVSREAANFRHFGLYTWPDVSCTAAKQPRNSPNPRIKVARFDSQRRSGQKDRKSQRANISINFEDLK